MKKRSVIYFLEKKKAREAYAAGAYYVKKGKLRIIDCRSFADQNRERRNGYRREYKDVLQFPIQYDQKFEDIANEKNIVFFTGEAPQPIRDIDRSFMKLFEEGAATGKDILLLKQRHRPESLPNNPFIRAHVHFELLDETQRYLTHVANIQPRQHSYGKHLTEYYEWLMPRIATAKFIVTGKNDLTAIAIPDKGFPDYYFKSEFLDQMNDAYKKIMQLIKDAKPKQ